MCPDSFSTLALCQCVLEVNSTAAEVESRSVACLVFTLLSLSYFFLFSSFLFPFLSPEAPFIFPSPHQKLSCSQELKWWVRCQLSWNSCCSCWGCGDRTPLEPVTPPGKHNWKPETQDASGENCFSSLRVWFLWPVASRRHEPRSINLSLCFFWKVPLLVEIRWEWKPHETYWRRSSKDISAKSPLQTAMVALSGWMTGNTATICQFIYKCVKP